MRSLFQFFCGALCLCTAMALFLPATLSAQESEEPVIAEASDANRSHTLNAPDVEAWLDGYMPYALNQMDIVGAVVTIVKDGEIIANHGYGYADIEANQQVDPDKTLFRPGSISKLFTWTAVMQLVEAGKLDLDADINSYLDFSIPAPRGTITLRHLMTHTPGFQTVLKDLFSGGKQFSDADLRTYLISHIPPQLFEPGKIPAYSNYGTAVAGYIVERTSGEPFASYIENHIFAPLGMANSSFRQPLPGALAENMSKGYKNGRGPTAQPYEIVFASPAGALSSTGSDMARFMTAHLNGGAGLLQPDTANRMHTTLHKQFPSLNGMALGFYRLDKNGLNIVSHGGDTAWFHSDMFLYLDHGVGVYMSVNSAGRRTARFKSGFFNAFTDRYFSAPKPEQNTLPTAREHGNAVAGTYEISRAAEQNAFAIGRYASQVTLSVNKDDELVAPFIRGPAGNRETLKEIEPWVWQSKSGRKISVRTVDGKVVAFSGAPAIATWLPVPWHRSSSWLNPAMIGAVAIIALTFLVWPIKAFARRRLRVEFPYSRMAKSAYRLAPIASFMTLVYLAGWAWFFIWISGSIYNLAADLSVGPLTALYWLAVLPVASTVLAGWVLKIRLEADGVSWFSKASAAALLLSNLVIIWFAVVNGLFSFSTNF